MTLGFAKMILGLGLLVFSTGVSAQTLGLRVAAHGGAALESGFFDGAVPAYGGSVSLEIPSWSVGISVWRGAQTTESGSPPVDATSSRMPVMLNVRYALAGLRVGPQLGLLLSSLKTDAGSESGSDFTVGLGAGYDLFTAGSLIVGLEVSHEFIRGMSTGGISLAFPIGI